MLIVLYHASYLAVSQRGKTTMHVAFVGAQCHAKASEKSLISNSRGHFRSVVWDILISGTAVRHCRLGSCQRSGFFSTIKGELTVDGSWLAQTAWTRMASGNTISLVPGGISIAEDTSRTAVAHRYTAYPHVAKLLHPQIPDDCDSGKEQTVAPR